jgi:predicted permease
MLMVSQIALSVVLLVSTGLFIRTLRNLQAIDSGFNRHNLALFRIDLVSAGYRREQYNAMLERVRERLERIPGVSSVTYSDVASLSQARSIWNAQVPGYVVPPGGSVRVTTNSVAPNFFDALELPIVLGRDFSDRDDVTAPKVAVVNQTFARTFFGSENPIGRQFGLGAASSSNAFIEIVGVARDAKYSTLRDAIPATAYVPAAQRQWGTMNFAVRTVADSRAVFSSLLDAMREIDPALPVVNLRTQDEQVDRNHARELLFARISGLFGALALGLACVGLYGLMSYTVLRRTGEIGLRMAIGAIPAQVLAMILRQSVRLVFLGISVGLVGAYAGSHVIATMLYGLSPSDPITYSLVALVLIAVALAASLIPALRASRINPITALRSE